MSYGTAGSIRVAMVTARCLPFTGGIETHVDEVAKRLVQRGIQLSLLTTDPTGKLPRFEERNGVVIERLPAWPKSKDYYFSPALARELARRDVDLVHVQGVHNAVLPLALATATRRRLPAIATFHTGGNSSRLRTALREIQWRSEGSLLRRTARLVAVCEYEVQLFQRVLRAPREQIVLIRNGSEPLPPSDVASAWSGSPLVVSVGRLERYKGHHRVIAAMPELLRSAPEAALVVVGTGPFERSLRQQVLELGLADSVSFTSFGQDDRSKLGALIRASDVVTLLSDYEAHPVAVMEALAEGANVLVAATSGLRELGRSNLVDLVDLNARPQTVCQAILNSAARQRWNNGPPPLPTWDDCAAELHALYEDVVA